MATPMKPAATVLRARELRREMSPAEVKLWCELRAKPDGLKFRRQHPAGPYSLDFYCATARLAVEVDGAFHDRGDAPARDAKRDDWLTRFGIETMRIPARELYANLDRVIAGIVAMARARLPLHHPAAPGGPPPQALLGEN